MSEPQVPHGDCNSLRVCLISREYPPETGWGGIATFTRHLALGLKELGHEVEVICLSRDEQKSAEQEGILVHRVAPFFKATELGLIGTLMPHFRYVMTTAPALWIKCLERHSEKSFDVIDAPELLADGIFAALTRIAPLVVRLYTPHSKFIADRLNYATANFDRLAVATIERLAMVQADILTSPSLDLANHVAADLNYSADDIRIVSNPIDIDEFSPAPYRTRNNAHNPADTSDSTPVFNVLFVGRLEERKGIALLIEAVPQVCRAIPGAQFIIVGDDTRYGEGGQSMLKNLKKSLAAARVLKNVTFTGRVTLQELPTYYRQADICVVPSAYDNSPYSCLEAMSCGIPVITSDAGGAKEYLEHGISGLVVPAKRVDVLAQSIISLLKDEQLRHRLGANARQRVLNKFQRKTIAQDTVELYKEACLSFHNAQRTPLYSHDPNKAVGDLKEICLTLESSLHELLYRVSYRHRVAHWLRLAAKRPRLFAAKVGAKLWQISGVSHFLPQQTELLNQKISKYDGT